MGRDIWSTVTERFKYREVLYYDAVPVVEIQQRLSLVMASDVGANPTGDPFASVV